MDQQKNGKHIIRWRNLIKWESTSEYA